MGSKLIRTAPLFIYGAGWRFTDECKKMLASNQYNHLSILGIAFEAGFNSKTAFNTSFKKSTGLSPKEFREQMNKETPGNIGSSLSTDL